MPPPWASVGTEAFLAFANVGYGNEHLISPREEDPSGWFHDHETGEHGRVCDRFTTFRNSPRPNGAGQGA